MRSEVQWMSILIALCACSAEKSPDGSSTDALDTAVEDTAEATLPEVDAALATGIQEIADSAAGDLEAGGLIIGVSVPGYAPYVAAAGIADEGTGERMAPDHISRIGSVTKTFVSAATLQLVDEGLLSLDDTVSQHIDVLARGDDITVAHLLSHTSGLQDYTYDSELAGRFAEAHTDEALIALIADDSLNSEPGSSFGYANTNYVLLGMLIEAVTGQRWDEDIESRFIEPLSLDDTRAPGGSEGWGATVPGYIGPSDVTSSLHPSLFGASGAMESSVQDQLVWGQAYLSGSLLSEGLHAQQLADDVVVSSGALWVRLGVFQWDSSVGGSDPELWHNGAVNGYAAWLGHRLDSGITISVLANGWIIQGAGSYDFNYPMTVSDEIWRLLESME